MGCLQANVDCLGEVLPEKFIFILTDTSPDVKEIIGVSGIIRMIVLEEVKSLFISAKGMERADKYDK